MPWSSSQCVFLRYSVVVVLIEMVLPWNFQQLRPGLPSNLRFIGLPFTHVDDVAAIIEQGFPMVRLARLNTEYYTVSWNHGKLQLEEWPQWRTLYCAREWLECLGCEDADWLSQNV